MCWGSVSVLGVCECVGGSVHVLGVCECVGGR